MNAFFFKYLYNCSRLTLFDGLRAVRPRGDGDDVVLRPERGVDVARENCRAAPHHPGVVHAHCELLQLAHDHCNIRKHTG